MWNIKGFLHTIWLGIAIKPHNVGVGATPVLAHYIWKVSLPNSHFHRFVKKCNVTGIRARAVNIAYKTNDALTC